MYVISLKPFLTSLLYVSIDHKTRVLGEIFLGRGLSGAERRSGRGSRGKEKKKKKKKKKKKESGGQVSQKKRKIRSMGERERRRRISRGRGGIRGSLVIEGRGKIQFSLQGFARDEFDLHSKATIGVEFQTQSVDFDGKEVKA